MIDVCKGSDSMTHESASSAMVENACMADTSNLNNELNIKFSTADVGYSQRDAQVRSCGVEEGSSPKDESASGTSQNGVESYKNSAFYKSETMSGSGEPRRSFQNTSGCTQHLEQQHPCQTSASDCTDLSLDTDASLMSNSSGSGEIEGEPKKMNKDADQQGGNCKRMSMEAAPYDFNDPMFSTDEFRVWEMKIRSCPKSRPHDWTMCPFAHPGEKAKRRDPRLFNYCGTACADYRKSGTCARGDACMYAHGVFECWLHPSRYRTQLCTDGIACSRRVCFFAHRECELRKPVGGIMPSIPPPGAHAGLENLNEMQRPRLSEDSRSLSAAIQMLDPLSKHRLLEALHNDIHGSATQSALYAGSPQVKSHQLGGEQSVIEAIQQLQLGSQYFSRRSFDDGLGISAHHSSGLPMYNQYLSSMNSSRKSVDIGAISRLASANTSMGDLIRPVQSTSSLNRTQADVNRNSLDLGSLYDTSSNTMLSHGFYQRRENVHANEYHRMTGRASMADDPRRSLSKISENPFPEAESEGTGSGRSSSIGTVLPTTNEGSNVSSKPTNMDAKTMKREFSLDNILAELPRSASQVELTQNH